MRASLLFICLCLAGVAAPAEELPFTGREARAQAGHVKQLERNPDSAAAHYAYAEFLSDHGRMRAAVAHWRMAQVLAPEDAAIANSLGGAYLRMGRTAQSAEQFQRAVDRAGEVAAYHYNLANVEFVLRRELAAAWRVDNADVLRRALAEFREARRLSPYEMEYARGYAETFYAMPEPDWTEAAAAWKHVLALSPRSDFAYLQLARVSLKLGDKFQARAFLDRISDPRHDGLVQKLRDQADRL